MDRNKYMDDREVKQLRASAQATAIVDANAGRHSGPVAWMLVDMALQTGLRVSEMAAINCTDFNSKRGALRVWRLKKRNGDLLPAARALRTNTKTPRGKLDTMALATNLVTHLNDHMGWKAAWDEPAGDDPLFVGHRGVLTASGLQQSWKASILRAGLPKELSIHSARHTLAVFLLQRTGNMRQVQKQLGHESIELTASLYGDVPFKDMAAGVSEIFD